MKDLESNGDIFGNSKGYINIFYSNIIEIIDV